MADPSIVAGQEVVRFPDVPKPPGLDEKEQYAVMLEAAKQRGGLRPGEDLTALPTGSQGPGGAWKSGGTITAPSGTVYDIYTRDPAPEAPTPSDTTLSAPPPGSDALQDVDQNFSPDPPDDTVAKCVTGFAEGFVEGFAVGYAVGFVLGALGPVGAVIGVGLLLYSAYQVVTNWDKIKAASPEEKARMIGGLAGGILGGGMGGRAGSQFRETITEPLGEGGGGAGEGYGPGKMPKDPNDLLADGWKEVTDPRNTSGSREFVNPKNGMKVRYDPGTPGDPGFGGKDHYHVENPDATGKTDYYLDKDGNPVPKGSKPSHILPNDTGEE